MEQVKTPIDHSAKQGANNVRTNVIMNLIRTITMTVLSFITFPYVCRILGDSVIGTYTWANTFVYYFVILAKISIPNIAIRECTKVKNDRKALSHLAQMFFLLQAIMTLLSFALMTVIIFSVPALSEISSLIFLLSMNFLIGVFSFEWIYIVLEKHFYITIRSIGAIALAALLTFTYVKQSSHPDFYLYIYAAITILSTLITAVCNCALLPRYISLKKEGPYDFRPYLKSLFVLFAVSMALTLYNETDTLLLGFIDSGKASVGSYSVGVKGIDIIITIITSLYAVFMPRANYYYNMDNKWFFRNLIRYSHNITFFIAIPALATMITMAGPITALISGNYETSGYNDSNIVLMVLGIMMLTYSIGDNLYTEVLIPSKREKIYLYTLLIGVVLNVSLSLIFGLVVFKESPVIGVAIATGLTDVLIIAFLIAKTWEYSKEAIFNLNNLKIVLFGIGIAVLSYFVGPIFYNLFKEAGMEIWVAYILELIVMVAIDAIIYIGGLLICHENLVSSFLPGHKAKEASNA